MNTFDRAHLALLRELEGFDDSALDSYFEVTPDGEYAEGQEQQYMEVQSSAPQAHYMAVSPAWLDEQQALLRKQPWFRAAPYGRKDAEAELKDAATGAFVVRPSSDVGKYAVSVKRKSGDVDHMLIIPSWAGAQSSAPGQTQYRIGTYSTALFNTVPKLVAYYIVHPFYGDEMLVGIVRPEEQEGGYGYIDVAP